MIKLALNSMQYQLLIEAINTNITRSTYDNIYEFKIKTMKIFKKLSDNKIKLDGIIYKPYNIGNIPPSFGFISNMDGDTEQTGIYQWFNYQGLTYIKA